MKITYIIDDKLGGIASLVSNLIDNKISDSDFQHLILIDKKESSYTRSNRLFNAEMQTVFSCSGNENAYAVLKRLYNCLLKEPGAVVLNDSLEMQLFDHFSSELTTFQIVHDSYNLDLALKFPNVVDVFIAHNKLLYNALLSNLPYRKDSIFYLPHGVKVPGLTRKFAETAPIIKLLFLGRMTAAKGIFDLPLIANKLDEWNIPYLFTCIGNGPELVELKKIWKGGDRVRFCTPDTNKEVLEICSQHDLFVFPTQFEGTPVSLLETMSVGLVPIVTDLDGGIKEIVTDEIGYRVPLGQWESFAQIIRKLYENPDLINRMSVNCIKSVRDNFNVKNTSAAYHRLFQDYHFFYKKKNRMKRKLGFRLDQPFLPSKLTQTLRSFKLK